MTVERRVRADALPFKQKAVKKNANDLMGYTLTMIEISWLKELLAEC